MATLPKWSRRQNWRNWLARGRTCCNICYHFGDALGNPPDHAVVVVSGKTSHRYSLKETRDLFKGHVKTHHEPEWLNDRLEWSIKQ